MGQCGRCADWRFSWFQCHSEQCTLVQSGPLVCSRLTQSVGRHPFGTCTERQVATASVCQWSFDLLCGLWIQCHDRSSGSWLSNSFGIADSGRIPTVDLYNETWHDSDVSDYDSTPIHSGLVHNPSTGCGQCIVLGSIPFASSDSTGRFGSD